ncbi:MAG: hypothetical protein AMXMBFR58_32970 [Phycisphaerae bacterium]
MPGHDTGIRGGRCEWCGYQVDARRERRCSECGHDRAGAIRACSAWCEGLVVRVVAVYVVASVLGVAAAMIAV